MNANEFRLIVDKLSDGLTKDQKIAIFNRVLGWLTADVSDGKGEQRLRLMIATQIREAITKPRETGVYMGVYE